MFTKSISQNTTLRRAFRLRPVKRAYIPARVVGAEALRLRLMSPVEAVMVSLVIQADKCVWHVLNIKELMLV